MDQDQALLKARLVPLVQPLLDRIARSLGCTASVGMLDRDDVVCVAAAGVGQAIPATQRPGARVPAYRTANGRVLLASLSGEQVERVLERSAPEHITTHTVVDKEELSRAIAQVRTQGYALVGQELELGRRTIAVPVQNSRGDVVAAMNITVHAGRMTAAQMVDRYLHALIRYQVELNAFL